MCLGWLLRFEMPVSITFGVDQDKVQISWLLLKIHPDMEEVLLVLECMPCFDCIFRLVLNYSIVKTSFSSSK
jgi:hypothetical protein